MTETVSLTREGSLFRIHIDLPLDPTKAATIADIVEQDACDAEVTIGRKRRLLRVQAMGLVTPLTMRRLISELAR